MINNTIYRFTSEYFENSYLSKFSSNLKQKYYELKNEGTINKPNNLRPNYAVEVISTYIKSEVVLDNAIIEIRTEIVDKCNSCFFTPKCEYGDCKIARYDIIISIKENSLYALK